MKTFVSIATLFLLIVSLHLYFAYQNVQDMEEKVILEESRSLQAFLKAFRQTYQKLFLQEHIVTLNEKSFPLLPVASTPQISEMFAQLTGKRAEITVVSDRPRNPDNKADPIESEAIKYFRSNPKESELLIKRENGQRMFYASPVRIKKHCLKCHGEREKAPPWIQAKYDGAYGYKEGDLRGVVSIKIDTQALHEDLFNDFRSNAVFTIISSIIFLGGIYFLIRRVNRHVVELEQAEQGLLAAKGIAEAANRSKGELLANRTTLLAGIAHDLRTPLTQIQLALSMMPNNGGAPDLMESIRSDLDEITNLIGDTLNISLELEAENAVLTDIAPALDNIVKAAQKNGVAIEWKRGEPCSRVVQILALRRIVTNLLANAVRYGKGKPVSVTYECNNKTIVIRIMDRGPGIPPEHAEAVFRPFFRLEMSRGSKTGGSGLGLAIVRQLVDTHGWDIELRQRSGGGTEAILSIS